MNKECIQEITRQLCHPQEGLPKNLKPLPRNLYSWKKCLDSLHGWVNLGISEKVAKMFIHIKIGEVIPSGASNLDFYTFGFATTEIQKFLQYRKHNEKNYLLILNYYSFCKLIELMLQHKSKEYSVMFHKSLKQIFTSCSEKTFWLNIPICEKVKEQLEKSNIGEIIVKNGTKKNKIDNDMGYTKVDWEDIDMKSTNSMIDEDDDIESISNSIESTHLSNTKKEYTVKEIMDDSDDEILSKNTYADNPYRIVMNNKSLYSFLQLSCSLHNIHITEDIFTRVGAYNDSLEDLFGSLSI